MPQFIEVVKLIVVLFAVIVGYTLTGIANNCLVKNEKFDFIVLIKGLVKTLTACLGLVIVAYVCTLIDLSGLGFQPQTAITSGILVYSAKLIRNAMGLLGLNKEGKDDIDPLLRKEEIIIENKKDEGESLKVEEENDFEEINIYNDSQNNTSTNNNEIEIDPKAVG